MRMLTDAVGEVAAGRGRAVWISGEPGIGKSALVHAGLAAASGSGCQVFWAAGQALLPTFPLQVLLEALRVGAATGGDELGLDGGVDGVRAIRAEIGRLLRLDASGSVTPWDLAAVVAEQILVLVNRLCAVTPAVLVLDDMQWADEASLGVWLRLGRAVTQLPLLLVAAGRPVPERIAVDVARRGLVDAGALIVELGPLGPSDVIEMVRRRVRAAPGPALVAQMDDASGNPLYVRELVDALGREGRIKVDAGVAELTGDPAMAPRTLPAAIQARLSFLSESTMAMLEMAALLGPVFSMVDLATVAGRSANDLLPGVGEALAAAVLADAAPVLAFRHGLVHQVLYEGRPDNVRAALHREAARALADAGAPTERVAEQLLAAPLPVDPWMIEWVARVVPALLQRAPQTAAHLIERVRDATGPGPQRDALSADLATAHFQLGHYDRVEERPGPSSPPRATATSSAVPPGASAMPCCAWPGPRRPPS